MNLTHMTRQEPEFIDLYGTQPDEPGWKRCWHGRELLWKVFWGYVLFGHGIVLGCALGVMVLGMVLGFAVDPGSLDAGLVGLSVGMGLLLVTFLVYGLFAMTALWRCAGNTTSQGATVAARGIVVAYAATMIWLVSKLLF